MSEQKSEIIEFDQIEPFKDILECLNELKRHFKLAAVSGPSHNMVEKVVFKFFPGCFNVIIAEDDLEWGKPNPDPYLKALEKLSMTKSLSEKSAMHFEQSQSNCVRPPHLKQAVRQLPMMLEFLF